MTACSWRTPVSSPEAQNENRTERIEKSMFHTVARSGHGMNHSDLNVMENFLHFVCVDGDWKLENACPASLDV